MDIAASDERVRLMLASELSVSPEIVTPTATLRENLRMTDLEYIEVADRLEQEFDIGLDDSVLFAARTVADVQAHVRECLEDK